REASLESRLRRLDEHRSSSPVRGRISSRRVLMSQASFREADHGNVKSSGALAVDPVDERLVDFDRVLLPQVVDEPARELVAALTDQLVAERRLFRFEFRTVE